MSHVLVLISNPDASALDQAVVDTIARDISDRQPVRWLAPGISCEIPFDENLNSIDAVSQITETARGARPFDIAILPDKDRRKRLLIADMDSTMIEQECIDEIGDTLGIKERIAAITEKAMNGEILFEDALRERVALLAGVSRDDIARVISERLTYTPGGRQLVATMTANGARCALVSGGFTPFTSVVAKRLGFHENQANELEFSEEKLTGRLVGPILGASAKKQALLDLSANIGGTEAALAVGDGANDLAMIKTAGLGVAFRAKPIVAEQVQVNITHGDLTALLYLQGYRDSEFSG
jgi:phosphoserine phosphatase